MKKSLLLFMVFMPILLFAQTSIYDIQYTTDAGDGSYPSSFNWQTVTTGGIVTATDYLTGQYFISSSKGGAWEGLFVYDNNYSPSIGDSILITGTVAEYNGYTEIKSLTSFEVKSTGNSLPETAKISTSEVTSEAYEGVLVELNDCNVSTVFDNAGAWWVNDGSGACEIRVGMYNLKDDEFSLILGYPFSSIKGVIGINNYTNSIHPRSIEDIQSADNALILFTNDKSVDDNTGFEIPVKIAILNQTESITSYSLKVQYDQAIFEYTGYNKTGTISESGTITDASTDGNIELNYSGSFACENIETLVNLSFTPIIYGNTDLQFSGTTINGNGLSYSSAGNLEYASSECSIPIGDTLTIVQRPLLNIPSIVVPGQELNIICFAPESTTDWGAELFYKDVIVPINIIQSSYDTDLERWTLTATIPDVDLYELYDLRVTASGGITDDVTNAVKVIDQFKTNYYFVHITDTHLPGHTFYGDSGYETDESEMDDLYEVIKDINLIRPEFVLLTGDLVNESELEDFECLRNHTLAVELLQKLEVPVYLVPGNHDLGGWDLTPPPTGTARKEWWRFFGWRQREIPPTKTEYYSHDYSFDYGNTHFTGLEAYETYGNYDDYMFDVYGNTSFTALQIDWLNADLGAAGDKTKVLFYHFDFKYELDLSALGVDMALWGHNHTNTGDINSYPYNLSTAGTCDESRTYRVVRVNGSDVQAENSIQTHSDGDMLTINYNMTNDGSLDSVSATVNNKFDQAFSNGLIKFNMPLSDYGYSVTNGALEQVMISGSSAICYVKANILAETEIIVSIKRKLEESPITKIYDIQYTTIAGDGTYPSTLNGQMLTTGGIVTAINYSGGRFFISSSQGGPWNGLFIYDNNYSPTIGDSILITGKVSEYSGYTEMIELSSFEVKSTSNPLPETAKMSTVDISSEAYEGVFVEVNNCNVSSIYDEWGNWMVNDGSGACEIRPGIYSLMNDEFPLINNYPFKSIIGVVGINYGNKTIHPRFRADIQSGENAFILITEDQNIESNSDVVLPVEIAILNPGETINSYSLKVQYDPLIFQYLGFDKTSTISESGTINDASTEGNLELNYTGSTNCDIISQLIKLNFRPLATGSANIQLNGTVINETQLSYSIIGTLDYTNNTTKIYDIQYSETAGSDGTYPSPLNGQTITTGGIVTATGYIDGRYFISSSQGGAWNGLFVYDNTNSPAIGDSILITGKVTEYIGFTEMIDLTSFEVISASNPLPETAKISTTEITSEAYEGVFVELSDCNVSSTFDEYGNWKVDDGSGECYIRPGIYALMNEDFPLIETYSFKYVKGVIGYHYGFTSLHPRFIEDIQSAENAFILITEDQSLESETNVDLPVKIAILNSSETINSYSLKVQYDPLIFQYIGFDKTTTISESGTITDASNEGNIELNYTGTTNCDIMDQLIKLNFTPLATGSASLQFSGTEINESDLSYIIIGSLEYTDNSTSVEDLNYSIFSQNFPNPFSTETKINFSLSEQANVNVSVYNMSGQLIKVLVNELKIPGEYSIIWDATNSTGSKVENGIYIYKYMIDGKQIESKQMLYIK